MRKKIFGSSWKMHKNTKVEVKSFTDAIKSKWQPLHDLDVFLIPSFPLISFLSDQLANTGIIVGAQNVSFVEHGPYTGEVSIQTLVDVGCKIVEIGHAERREHFNETNETVAKKVQVTVTNQCIPLICVGETLTEKNAKLVQDVLKEQVLQACKYVAKDDLAKLIFAYEPVWAIGQAEGADSEYVNNQHAFIRSVLASIDSKAASLIRIIYGGSVKKESAAEMIAQPEVDGLFAGRFALDPNNFLELVKIVKDSQN